MNQKTSKESEMGVQNRNTAFIEILDKLPEKRKKVYNLIKKLEPVSARQICNMYNQRANEIQPRFTELVNSGHIVECGTINDERSGKPNSIYRATTEQEMVAIRDKHLNALQKEAEQLRMDVECFHISDYSKEVINKRLNLVKNLISNLI
jgi:predicted ArsR family transcriptional regulator